MGLTISNLTYDVWGRKRAAIFDIAFDSSYAFDGETLAPGTVGLSEAEQVIVSGKSGYGFEYDITNQKVKVFANAPPIVYEEVVVCTAKVGYLKYPAAHIEYVTDDSNDYRVVPGGLTPITKTVAVDMGFSLTTGVLTKGQRTKLTFHDAVSTCKVSYITQAWKEVTDNMVQACMTSGVRTYGHADLAFTAGTPDEVVLGEDFVAMQSILWNDAGTIKPCWAIKTAVDPTTGGGECALDFQGSSGKVLFKEEDAVDTTGDIVYFNYIKDPGAGSFLHDRFVNSEIADA